MSRRSHAALAAAWLSLAFAAPSFAVERLPSTRLRPTVEAGKNKLPADLALLAAASGGRVSSEFAMRMGGVFWEQLTPQQRAQWVEAATRYLSLRHTQQADRIRRAGASWRLQARNGDTATVETRLPGTPEVTLAYRMALLGGRWQIVDMALDAQSLIEASLAETRQLARDGDAFAAMLARLNERSAQLER